MAPMYVRVLAIFLVISCGMHVASSQAKLGMMLVKEGVNFVATEVLPKLASFIGIPVQNDNTAIMNYINAATDRVMLKLDNIQRDLEDNMVLQGNMISLRTASASILNSMKYIKKYMLADPVNQEEKQQEFLKEFATDSVEKNTLLLTDLFTNDYGLDQPNFVSLVLGQNKCNITRGILFFGNCARLVSYGIFAQIQYTKLSLNDTESELKSKHLQEIIDDWNPIDNQMNDAFTSAIKLCKDKWQSIALADLKNAESTNALWAVNNKWQPWFYNDVIFYKGRGTFQFAYSTTERRSVVYSNYHYSVFYNNETVEYGKTREFITAGNQSYQAAINGRNDEQAAQNVANSVEAYLTHLNYDYENIIVLFDEGEGGQVEEHVSQGSPLLAFSLDEVQLDLPVQLDWKMKIQTVTGKFKVYVYLRNQITGSNNQKGHTVDSGFTISCNTLLIAVLVLFVVNV